MGGTLPHVDFTEFVIAHVLCCIMNMVEIWLHLYSSGRVIIADQLPGTPEGPGGGALQNAQWAWQNNIAIGGQTPRE